MTILMRAARWLAAGRQWRRLARAAWRDGADLYAVLLRLTSEPERPIWPEPGTQTPCPSRKCRGRHCKGCDEPARITATWTSYVARHCQDEIPPSILVPALMMTAVERAKALTRELGNAAWRPGRPYRTAVSW